MASKGRGDKSKASIDLLKKIEEVETSLKNGENESGDGSGDGSDGSGDGSGDENVAGARGSPFAFDGRVARRDARPRSERHEERGREHDSGRVCCGDVL